MLSNTNNGLIRGQSLIGILVALAVFSILAQAIFTVVGASFNFVSFNRARITAKHLAQEKLELLRNLPFDNVGTLGGVPWGPILREETITRNKLNYTVKTEIIYIDDPFDGTEGGIPDDTLATDYKRVRVEVSWEGVATSRKNPVVLLSDIAPKGVETTAGGGTLSILVFNSNGDPIPQATVTIIANSLAPPINITTSTSDNGRVIRPGMPICNSCYEITVTKPGYSVERTYSTSEVANPNKPHQTILDGALTEISFAIDQISTLVISTVDSRENSFASLGNVNFQLRGQKTIGVDTSGQSVYKYDEALSTDSSGTLNLTDFEWDNYVVILEPSSPYDISGANPYLPIAVLPNTNPSLVVSLSPHTTNSLLTTFVDTSNTPVASVSAILSDAGSGYSETKYSGGSSDPDFGQTFFPGLQAQSYLMSATASGFLDFSNNIDVLNQTQEQIILTPQ